MNRRYDAAVFDMDGTILDTLGDLTDSLNWGLEQAGHRHDYTPDMVRLFFGSAARTGVMRALAAEQGADEGTIVRVGETIAPETLGIDLRETDRILKLYQPYYTKHCRVKTGPYAGIPELLGRLRAAGVKTAVVSNKPDAAVQALCRAMFPDMFDFCLGEKEAAGIRRKPYPDMVRTCLTALGVPAERSVYIGDTEIDLLTAENSGLDLIPVSWGFRTEQYLRSLGLSTIAGSPDDVYHAIIPDI